MLLRRFACALGRNLLTEIVSLAEYVPDSLNNVFGVLIGLGEDECFGDFGPAWKDFFQLVAERADDESNLVVGDDIAV